MNFNVYLDAVTVTRLNTLARQRGTTRNALIREAVAQLLDGNGGQAWPETVRTFVGLPDAPRFEASRRKLRAPRKDPLR